MYLKTIRTGASVKINGMVTAGSIILAWIG